MEMYGYKQFSLKKKSGFYIVSWLQNDVILNKLYFLKEKTCFTNISLGFFNGKTYILDLGIYCYKPILEKWEEDETEFESQYFVSSKSCYPTSRSRL